MRQEPYPEIQDQQRLTQMLMTLSAREQIGLLLRASRTLSHRDKAEVLGKAGLHFFKDRFLSIFVHVFLKHVIAGTIWWILAIVGVVLMLLLLLFVGQVNSQAVTPVMFGIISYLAGFFAFTVFAFFQSLAQFVGKTRSANERTRLLNNINALNYPAKVATLNTLSRTIANKLPGESLKETITTSGLLIVVGAILIGAILLLSRILPTLGSQPWILLLAGCTFVSGFLLPQRIQSRSRA